MKDLDKLKAAVSGVLGTDLPTQEGIRECIGLLRRSFPSVTDEEANELARWFEEVHGVKMRDGAALQDTGFEPWLEDVRLGTGSLLLEPLPQISGEQGLLRTCACHAG